jgi:hypothetical protein
MNIRVFGSLLVLAGCVVTLLLVRSCHDDRPRVDDPVERLRAEVFGSSPPAGGAKDVSPAETVGLINASPSDVRGRFLTSLVKASSPAEVERNAEVLDDFIRQIVDTPDSIAVGRIAVAVAGGVWASGAPGSPARERMLGTLVFAANHPNERVHHGFLMAVAENTELLTEPAIRQALDVLTASPETELNTKLKISARAKTLLSIKPGKSYPPEKIEPK